MKSAYIAGPDVFREDYDDWKKAVADKFSGTGITPIFPSDAELTHPTSEAIFETNCRFMRNCDIVIANVNPFRGLEPDSGTAFEIGYARAIRKPVILYCEDGRSMRERLGSDKIDGCSVEDFGLPVNLMLAHAATAVVTGGIPEAIAAARQVLMTTPVSSHRIKYHAP